MKPIPIFRLRTLARFAVLALVVGLAFTGSNSKPAFAACGTTNLALNQPATASSVENGGTTANLAVDGNTGTRWSSTFSDPQWLQVDLGSTQSICGVTIIWETAYATAFQIQVSPDAANWTPIFSTTNGTGGTQVLTGLSGSGRYIRMNGTARATQYGYSIWEFQVFAGSSAATNTPTNTSVPATATRTNTPTNTPLGPPTNTPIPSPTGSGGCTTANVALNKTATASSAENAGTTANFAVDGNLTTRWSSLFSDPQWLQVDLGATYNICHVTLTWEAAYATAYQIQVSNDAATWTTIYSTTTGTGGTNDLTGLSGSGRYIRMYGTARATGYGYSLWEFQVYAVGVVFTPTPQPTLTPTMDASFWGDTSTIPPAQNVMMFEFLNKTNGKYPDSQVYWSFNGTTQSIANQKYFDMPANSSGRMYFYLGAPNSQYQDFIEFTIGPAQFNGNTTRVDGFGLKLAIRLHTKDGIDQAVGEDETTFLEDRSVTFQKFINEVPTEFQHLAQISAPFSIPAPAHGADTAFLPGGQYGTYFDAYAASVGSTAKTADIFGCSNSLATNSPLCSALNRHVAQLAQTQWATPSLFYQAAPANYYARFWHNHDIGGLAYGFPYDDYGNQASYMSQPNPQWMQVAIGW